MFGILVEASEATRLSMGTSSASIVPALSGCVQCGTRRMIAAPVLGTCEGCGSSLQVLIATERAGSGDGVTTTRYFKAA
jgi:hypothetical protein